MTTVTVMVFLASYMLVVSFVGFSTSIYLTTTFYCKTWLVDVSISIISEFINCESFMNYRY